MKKCMAFLLSISFFMQTITATQMCSKEQLEQLWRCGIAPKKYGCSSEQIAQSRRWLVSGSAGNLVKLLTQAGIVVSSKQVKNEQEKMKTRMKMKSNRSKIFQQTRKVATKDKQVDEIKNMNVG